MEFKRAKEVIDLPYLVNIDLAGIPVYLEKINADSRTATVFPLDNMEHVQSVDLNYLTERGPIN